MGSKNKLKRFKENETFNNVFQPERSTLINDLFQMKGDWRKKYFKNKLFCYFIMLVYYDHYLILINNVKLFFMLNSITLFI